MILITRFINIAGKYIYLIITGRAIYGGGSPDLLIISYFANNDRYKSWLQIALKHIINIFSK